MELAIGEPGEQSSQDYCWVKKLTKSYNVQQWNGILGYLCYKKRERNTRKKKVTCTLKKGHFFHWWIEKGVCAIVKEAIKNATCDAIKKPARLLEIGNAVIEEHGTFKCQEKSQFKKKEKKIMQVPSDRLEMLFDAMPAASDSQRCCMSWRLR